jgi:hypothetical protein
MGLLDLVVRGKIKVPDRFIIYGPDGLGKSTLSSSAPKPIFVGPERGTANLDVARMPGMSSLPKIMDTLQALTNEGHDFQTLVIDSLDWIEPLIWDQVCLEEGVANIEQVGGGYGKGYVIALKMWHRLYAAIEVLQSKRAMGFIGIAHSQIRTFNDPHTNSSYDRYSLKMNEKAAALSREFVDVVFFATYQTFTKGKENAKHKAYGDGSRRMYSQRRPAFDAKSRYAIPFDMPLSYQDYREAIDAGEPEKLDVLKANIEELLKDCVDEELIKKVRTTMEKAGSSIEAYLMIQDRLRSKLGKEET